MNAMFAFRIQLLVVNLCLSLAGKKEASVEVRGSQSHSIIAQIC